MTDAESRLSEMRATIVAADGAYMRGDREEARRLRASVRISISPDVGIMRRSAAKPDPLDCIHLGDEIGVTKPKSCGCRGAWTRLHTCEIYGTCTPICAAKDVVIKSCRACEDIEVRSQ